MCVRRRALIQQLGVVAATAPKTDSPMCAIGISTIHEQFASPQTSLESHHLRQAQSRICFVLLQLRSRRHHGPFGEQQEGCRRGCKLLLVCTTRTTKCGVSSKVTIAKQSISVCFFQDYELQLCREAAEASTVLVTRTSDHYITVLLYLRSQTTRSYSIAVAWLQLSQCNAQVWNSK